MSELPSSPYKGLAAFGDSALDALLFFGREREREAIVSNLLATKLTVLYGPSGVGKSSLVRAGVAQRLRAIGNATVVVHDSWVEDPAGAVVASLREACPELGPTAGLVDTVAAAAQQSGEVYLLFDQFEEYFLYHGSDGPLADYLPELLRRPGLRLNMLISLRGDAVAELDAFAARLPGVFGNMLRLDRLDRRSARSAITGPLQRYSELAGATYTAETALIETLLDEVAPGRVDFSGAGEVMLTDGGVEAPYLQLVLERLWSEETADGSHELRLASFRRLGGVLRSEAFDIVHVHSSIISPAAYAAIHLAQKAGLPTVSTGHSIWGGFTRFFRTIDRWVDWSRWPVAFSSVSERVARELRPLVAPRPVDILPNAIEPAEWRLTPRAPAGVINIACVMRLVPRKRGATLVRAMREVFSQLPAKIRVRLQIAGDGPERARLERLTRQLGLSDSIHFLGSLNPAEIKILLARSHFFVLASKLEAFGIAALEARAAGLPVIAMRDSGVSEFIVHGREGLLAADDAEFAHQLFRLCTDTPLRNSIAGYNRSVPVTFTWEQTLAAHLATYERARRLSASVEIIGRRS